MGKAITTVYMDEEILNAYRKEAKKQERTITWLMTKALENYLETEETKKLVKENLELQNKVRELQNKINKIGKLSGVTEKHLSKKESGKDNLVTEKINEQIEKLLSVKKRGENWKDYVMGSVSALKSSGINMDILTFESLVEERLK